MGEKPADVEREVLETRRRISERTARLKERVRDDVVSVREQTTQQVNQTIGGTVGKVGETIEDTVGKFDIEGYLKEYPLVALAGGLGAGVVLGVLSEGISLKGDGQHGNGPGRYSEPGRSREDGHGGYDNDGLFGGVTSLLMGTVGAALQTEIRDLIRETFRGKEQGRAAA